MRCVYERTDGTPRFEVKVRWKQDGQAMYLPTRSFPFGENADTKRDARLKAEAYAVRERSALRTQGRTRSSLAGAWSVKALLERFQEDLGEIKKEHEQYGNLCYTRVLLRDFSEFIATRADNITPEVIDEKLLSKMKGKNGEAKPDSQRRMVSFLGTFVNHCRKSYKVDIQMPRWKSLDLPSPSEGREVTIDDDEFDRVTASLNRTDPLLQIAIHLYRYTACRRAEILNLLWEDIDFDNGTALLRNTKSHNKKKKPRNRYVPIPASTLDKLRPLRKVSGLVFVNPETGKRFGIDAPTRAWIRARRRAKINQEVRLHDLRHTRITELVGLLPSPLEVASVSGHTDLKTLQRYYNPKAKELGAKIAQAESKPMTAKAKAKQVLGGLSEKEQEALASLLRRRSPHR